MREDGLGKGGMGGVDAECKHDDDATRTSCNGKSEGIEGFFSKTVDLGRGYGGDGCLRLFRVWSAVLLIQQRPADHGDDDAAGDLHDGEGDAEEAQEGGADEFDDGEEDDGVNGDAASEVTVGLDRSSTDQAKEDERRSEWVDERKERAEAQSKVFPENVHGFQEI